MTKRYYVAQHDADEPASCTIIGPDNGYSDPDDATLSMIDCAEFNGWCDLCVVSESEGRWRFEDFLMDVQ